MKGYQLGRATDKNGEDQKGIWSFVGKPEGIRQL
jgi:hypothetical protein